ncbi:hypothetical protein B0T20DRAFT_76970 [Sordaria brevicollis]|uniref:DUF7735 domain-containing protein n=1 Tax=Sordaria brevicollis TaxID=83679 RepID=A0AAE0P119_SORBR|nr:hypothetical protein B0T20DRAFT_76970 [Sordaria brevicollis]
MRSNTLLAAGLAATASASAVPQRRADIAAPLITPGPILHGSPVQDALRAHNQAGQGVDKRAYAVGLEIEDLTGSGDKYTSCILGISSVLRSWSAAAPYPSDTAFASWVVEEGAELEEPITTVPLSEASKACETPSTIPPEPTIPASFTSAYSSYSSEALEWFSAGAKGVSSVAKDCPTKVGQIFELVYATDVAECKALANKINGKSTDDGKKDDSKDDGKKDDSNGTSGVASNSAPIFAAIAAFAGLVGVIAL